MSDCQKDSAAWSQSVSQLIN